MKDLIKNSEAYDVGYAQALKDVGEWLGTVCVLKLYQEERRTKVYDAIEALKRGEMPK